MKNDKNLREEIHFIVTVWGSECIRAGIQQNRIPEPQDTEKALLALFQKREEELIEKIIMGFRLKCGGNRHNTMEYGEIVSTLNEIQERKSE